MQKAIKFGVTTCMVPAYAIELKQPRPTASTDTPGANFASMLQGYEGELENYVYLADQDYSDLEKCNEDSEMIHESDLRACNDQLDQSLIESC